MKKIYTSISENIIWKDHDHKQELKQINIRRKSVERKDENK